MDGAQETLQSYELYQPSQYGKSNLFRDILVGQNKIAFTPIFLLHPEQRNYFRRPLHIFQPTYVVAGIQTSKSLL